MADLAVDFSGGAFSNPAKERSRIRVSNVIEILFATAIVASMLVVVRSTRKWKAVIRTKSLELAQRARELNELNETLDRKVYDRTKELEDSRTAALMVMREAESAGRKSEQANESLKREVTERATAEKHIQRLVMIVEQAVEGIAVADLDGKLQFVNPAWVKIHGYETGDELVGKHLSVFHNVEQLNTEVIPFNEEVKRVGNNVGEVGHIHKDGTPFPSEMKVGSFKDEQGAPIGLVAFMTDITERKRFQHDLDAKINDLEEFNRLAVDREIKMIELKEEVNRLLAEHGVEKKYKTVE